MRVLVASAGSLAFIVGACSHDWSQFEPTGSTSSGGAASSGGGAAHGGAGGAGGNAGSAGASSAMSSGGSSATGGGGGASSSVTSGNGGAGGGTLCGNGVVDPGEECDDHNAVPDDGCTNCIVDCGEPNAFKDPATHHCYWSVATGSAWAAARTLCQVDAHSDLAALSTIAELDAVGAHLPSGTWLGGSWNGSAWVWSFNEPWTYGDDQGGASAPWATMHPGENHMFRQCVFLASSTTIDADHCTTDLLPSLCERTP